MMKELRNSIFIIFLFGGILAILYFYIPSSVKLLNEKVSNSNPLVMDINRKNLHKEYNSFLSHNLPENNPALYFYWYSNQRKISDLRVKKAITEIKNSKVNNNEIKIWSLINMGVVIKTNTKTIAIDTANLFFSQAYDELTTIADIFIVTHSDSDHYDTTLLKKALSNNKKVVFLEGIYPLGDKTKNITLSSGEIKDIDNIKITAFQTDHRGDNNFANPCAWFVIEANGFKLLHTGDGRNFKDKSQQQKVYSMKDLDILLANNQLHPYNIRDLSPKVLIPLHLFKFMSGNDLYQESTIETVMENHSKYAKELQGMEKIYLLPGESYSYTPKK